MLRRLHLENVGTLSALDIEPGNRLNLFTGDNGLGKTFLLDVIWWTLTGTWVGLPAWPQPEQDQPVITYWTIGDMNGNNAITSRFDFANQTWPQPTAVSMPSLVIYARVDGSFSVWDQARSSLGSSLPLLFSALKPGVHHFTADALWNGLHENGKTLCNGLIYDWIRWQYQPEQKETSPFAILSRIIHKLSPHPLEQMKPGNAKRVSIQDVREIPTIDLPYGNVPVIYASAGMKRILGLAYLLVWTWQEHTVASGLLRRNPTNRLVLLMDEVEAHLHPRWQRTLLPALLSAVVELQSELEVQIIATTHSPLTLASVEPYFNAESDKLFLFNLQDNRVTLVNLPWTKQGDTANWLTSEVFGLRQARSQEAEIAIEAAEALMRGETMEYYPEHLRTQNAIHQELLQLLPGHDPFWPRWLVETNLLPAHKETKAQ